MNIRNASSFPNTFQSLYLEYFFKINEINEIRKFNEY